MCKVLMIAGINKDNKEKVQKLVLAAAKTLSRSDEDGVGYAAITSKGAIYGEKWLNKADAFTMHGQPQKDKISDWISETFGATADFVKPIALEQVYESFGRRTTSEVNDTVAMILHARKATSGSKSISNVHPFYVVDQKEYPDTALIHNGSIINHNKLTKTMSTCDSEVILHEYLDNQMYDNPWGVESLAKRLIGEYTVGVLGSTQDHPNQFTPYLDIFKSHKDLYAAFVPEIGQMVYATSDYHLEDITREVGMTLKNMIKIKDGYLIRINAVTGGRMEEIIQFTQSARYEPYNNYNQYGPNSQLPGKTEVQETLAQVKSNFEKKHPRLFMMPYLEANNALTHEEREYFRDLDKNPNTNHKALHLVAMALANKA